MQTYFASTPAEGYAGMPADLGIKRDDTYFNSASEVAQVDTITVGGTVAAGDEVVIFVNSIPATVIAAAGDTLGTIKDKLVAALNLLMSPVQATSTGAAVFTLTGQPGIGFTTRKSTTGTTTATIANTTPVATAGFIPLGVAVVREIGDNEKVCRLGAASATHRFLGVTRDPGYLETSICETPQRAGFRRTEPVSVRAFGTIWVRVETDIAIDDPVFYRYSGAGQIGAFRNATAAGADVELTNARWMSPGKAGGIAKLELGGFAWAAQ